MFLFIHHVMFENSPDALMIARSAVWWWPALPAGCGCMYCIFMNLGADLKDSFWRKTTCHHTNTRRRPVLTPRRHISKLHHTRTRTQAEAGGCPPLHNIMTSHSVASNPLWQPLQLLCPSLHNFCPVESRRVEGTNLLFAQPKIFFLRNPSGTFRDIHW